MPLPAAESPTPISAYVVQAEERPQSINLAQESYYSPLVVRPPSVPVQAAEHFSGISNRHAEGIYRLAYVNGIGTSTKEAEEAAQVVKRSFGVDRSELTVLHNSEEHFCHSASNIVGALVSSRLGNSSEPECVNKLKEMIRNTLKSPHDRLILVSHSQGTLITQNALDRVYDEYMCTTHGARIWKQESPRIEVIMYAPIVRTIVPGPEAVSLLNACDVPARGIGGMQRFLTATKHYSGWREQQLVDIVIYSPKRNSLAELALSPSLAHNSVDLILDNTEFNFKILAKDKTTKKIDGIAFAANLAQSIALGRRSDALHHELIIKGCSKFGHSFAQPFLNQLSQGKDEKSKCLGRFIIADQRLERLQRSAFGH